MEQSQIEDFDKGSPQMQGIRWGEVYSIWYEKESTRLVGNPGL